MDKVVTYSFQEISTPFHSLVIPPHHVLLLGRPDVVVVELQRGAALPLGNLIRFPGTGWSGGKVYYFSTDLVEIEVHQALRSLSYA